MHLTKTQMALIGVFVVTAISVPAWQQTRLHRLATEQQEWRALASEAVRLRTELAALKAQAPDHGEFERLRSSETDLKLEVARLRAELTAARRPLAEPDTPSSPAAEEAPAQTNALSASMKGLMRGTLEQQLQGQLTRMKERLHLSADQESAIRAIHSRQIDQAAAVAEKMFSGQLSQEEMRKLQAASGNPEEEIRALLSPEQLEAYEQHKLEEARANARLVANAELLQIQGSLGLDQAQQDRVFEALYDCTVTQLSGQAQNADGLNQARDAAEAVDLMIEAKAKALAEVLTPEQLARYREFQRQQMDMIKGMLPIANP